MAYRMLINFYDGVQVKTLYTGELTEAAIVKYVEYNCGFTPEVTFNAALLQLVEDVNNVDWTVQDKHVISINDTLQAWKTDDEIYEIHSLRLRNYSV
ncbi:hypothetical protein IWW55_002138 [Coemansia sp. RSA 2706]|nr:hypothetical protein IWW55_002138 [Coemansia sp. RSA 2706]